MKICGWSYIVLWEASTNQGSKLYYMVEVGQGVWGERGWVSLVISEKKRVNVMPGGVRDIGWWTLPPEV